MTHKLCIVVSFSLNTQTLTDSAKAFTESWFAYLWNSPASKSARSRSYRWIIWSTSSSETSSISWYLRGLTSSSGFTRRNPTAPHRCVGNVRLTDHQANTPFESVCGRSWAVSWKCHSQPPGLLSILMFGLPKLFVPRGVRQISTDTDSELLWLRVFARWLLFAQRALCFQSGRTLEPPVFGRLTTLGS